MHQQLWGYKIEDKIYPGVRERKRFNITELNDSDGNMLCGSVRRWVYNACILGSLFSAVIITVQI